MPKSQTGLKCQSGISSESEQKFYFAVIEEAADEWRQLKSRYILKMQLKSENKFDLQILLAAKNGVFQKIT